MYVLNFTVDVTVCHRGYHGDLNDTFLIGNVSKTAEKLVTVTWECLEKAINAGKILYKMYKLLYTTYTINYNIINLEDTIPTFPISVYLINNIEYSKIILRRNCSNFIEFRVLNAYYQI